MRRKRREAEVYLPWGNAGAKGKVGAGVAALGAKSPGHSSGRKESDISS